MSVSPTIFINGKYVGPIVGEDWRAYVEQNYPGAKYELVDGWKVMVTVTIVQAMEIVEGRKRNGT
jgi:hypothetical protein